MEYENKIPTSDMSLKLLKIANPPKKKEFFTWWKQMFLNVFFRLPCNRKFPIRNEYVSKVYLNILNGYKTWA